MIDPDNVGINVFLKLSTLLNMCMYSSRIDDFAVCHGLMCMPNKMLAQ